MTSLHRIRTVFTSDSIDAGFAGFRSARPGQPPALPADIVLLISRTGTSGEGFTAWGVPPPPAIRRPRIPAPTKAAIA
ncbi:MAG: hypothetical protein ACLGIS_18540 [Actinomycetes bacterium]